ATCPLDFRMPGNRPSLTVDRVLDVIKVCTLFRIPGRADAIFFGDRAKKTRFASYSASTYSECTNVPCESCSTRKVGCSLSHLENSELSVSGREPKYT